MNVTCTLESVFCFFCVASSRTGASAGAVDSLPPPAPLPNPLQVIELLFWPSYPEVAFPSSLLLPMPAVTHLGVAAETQKVKKEKVTENSPYFNP